LFRDRDEETAVQSPDGGSKVTWSGPPLKPRPERERMSVVTTEPSDLDAEVARLISLGAVVNSVNKPDAVTLVDPDGNEFALTTRD
jgi:hypothetical protein